MNTSLEDMLIAAVVGLASWFVKDFLFGLSKKRNELERIEWEYRLKEIYCPLYFWSGFLAMRADKQVRNQICEHLHVIMAKAVHVIPQVHYYTLIRLLETAHGQNTSGVTKSERDRMRAYLYNQIEAFNFILYRSEEAGGIGDPNRILKPYRRLLRLSLIALSHLLVWLFVALMMGGILWLCQNRHFGILGFIIIVLLVIICIDTKRRAEINQGIETRLSAKS